MEYRASCYTGSLNSGGYKLTKFSRIGDIVVTNPDAPRQPYVNDTLVAGAGITPYPAVDETAYSHGYATQLSASYTKHGPWECFQITPNTAVASGSVPSSSFCGSTGSCTGGCGSTKHGHKVVQSLKYWHGRPGFICRTGSCNEIATKYRTVRRYSDYKQGETYTDGEDSGSTVINYSGSVDKTWTVGKTTGVVNQVSCSLVISASVLGYFPYDMLFSDTVGFDMFAGDACITTADSASNNYVYDDGYGYVDSYYLSYSDTGFTSVVSNETPEQGQITFFSHTTVCELSDPYTMDDLYADGVHLLNYVKLNDDVNYPWRTDGVRGAGPLLHYYEFPGAKNPDVAGEVTRSCDWTVPSCDYDGYLYGQLYGSNVDRMFSWDHVNWLWAFGSFWQSTYYGAWTGTGQDTLGDGVDAYMPLGCDAWTSNYDANYAPAGAFALMMGYGSGYNDAIWMQKYEEVKEQIQSQNYFRPCGEDKYDVDYTKATYTGGSVTIAVNETITVGDDMTSVWSNGDYIVLHRNLVTIKNLTSTTFQIASVVSTDDTIFPDLLDAGVIAKCRWYPEYKRGICGRAGITSITSSGQSMPVTCSLDKQHYFIDNDIISLSSSIGYGVSAGLYSVKRIDTYRVGLNSTSADTSSALLTNSYLYNSASIDYHWDDIDSKGDIVAFNSQTIDPNTSTGSYSVIYYGTVGDMGRFQTTVVPSQYCANRYFGASPNNDLHTGSTSLNFPESRSFAASTCGAGWQLYSSQHIQDPLWQQHYYYNGVSLAPVSYCPPYVEPRITPPTGAALPSSVTNGLPTGILQGMGAFTPTTAPAWSEVAWNLCAHSDETPI